MEWIEISSGHKRLVVKCGCKEEEKETFSFHKYREPTAFGHDVKTGAYLAVDKKGKKFDPRETRYNINRDRFGWRVTGKKVRPTDQYGRPN